MKQLAVQSDNAIHRFAIMLKAIGYEVELFNSYHKSTPSLRPIQQAALDIQIELLTFLKQTVKCFRDGTLGTRTDTPLEKY